MKKIFMGAAFGLAFLCVEPSTNAGPIATNLFAFRVENSVNSAERATGDLLSFGANNVSPNTVFGFASQCPIGSTCPPTSLTEQALFARPQLLTPNQYVASTPYDPALTGPQTLNLSPSLSFPVGNTTVVKTPAVGNVAAIPFVTSMTATVTAGGGLTPTLSSTPPPSPISIDQTTIRVFDTTPGFDTIATSADPNLPEANGAPSSFETGNVVYLALVPAGATTFQINTSSPGTNPNSIPLQYGHSYAVSVSLENLRAGSPPPNINSCLSCNVNSRSQSFFDYSPINTTLGGILNNATINLPTTQPFVTTNGLLSGPTYAFHVGSVSPDSITFIDPLVATGFIYTIGATDPDFKSVDPVTAVGNGIYILSVYNGTSFVVVDSALDAGQTFDFTQNGFPGGVSEFEITGIDSGAGLDPTNITAFVTGLTFVSAGSFTGTMQPIVEDVPVAQDVPEPVSIVLFGSGLFGFGLLRRRRTSVVGRSQAA